MLIALIVCSILCDLMRGSVLCEAVGYLSSLTCLIEVVSFDTNLVL